MNRKILPDMNDARRKSKGRPEYVDKIPRRVLFSTQGSTGWRRRRDIRNHKGNKSEENFDHLNHKFWGEGDDPV